MKKLFKGGKVIDVFTESIIDADVLIEDGIIIGVGEYDTADEIIDCKNKFISPGFIDGHIHIESTMLNPIEFAKIVLKHGTTAVVTDPHEITNVCGINGFVYMLKSTEGLPLKIFCNIPSCVPATHFDESFEPVDAEMIEEFIDHPRVLGLAEMMNYPGVIYKDPTVMEKITLAKAHNKMIDGHAPFLFGRDLDTYISAGIANDHECSTMGEAMDRIKRGQWLMIREGTAARNLEALIELFDTKASNRCLLVTDDKEPNDLIKNGHIDAIIRKAVSLGKNPITGIKMASINAAQSFRLDKVGAIAPSYKADFLILDDLYEVRVRDTYIDGKCVVSNGQVMDFPIPKIRKGLEYTVTHTMHVNPISKEDLYIEPKSNKVRVIECLPGELITNELICELNFNNNNGIDVENDILKLAVIERHHETGHIGKGFIKGIGLKSGAIASTVSHDSHNIIVLGTNDEDMALAVNEIIKLGGGNVICNNGKIVDSFSLPIAGLMSDLPIEEIAEKSEAVREIVYSLGVDRKIAPFMNMAFISLPVIPKLKLTTLGLVDVTKFELVDLFL